MKKKLVFFVLTCVILIFPSIVYAEKEVENNTTRDGKAEVNVYFEKDTGDKIKPTIYEPSIKPTVTTLLPKTNEMIQTLLILLTGIGIIIIVLGLMMFKRTYEKKIYIF